MVRPMTIADVVQELLSEAVAGAPHEPLPLHEYSRCGPQMQWALQERAVALLEVITTQCSDDRLRGVISSKAPAPARRAGFLEQMSRVAEIGPSTVIQRNPLAPFEFIEDAEGFRLIVDGRTYGYPAASAPLMTALPVEPCRIEDLPVDINIDDVAKLVAHLVNNGVLRIVLP